MESPENTAPPSTDQQVQGSDGQIDQQQAQGGAGASENDTGTGSSGSSVDTGATFEGAIDTVLANEGGYSNDPNDPGGETKYGIPKREYPDLDIKNLTVDQAKQIYQSDYWHYDGIQSQEVATKIFDMAVNMGSATADRILQDALNALGQDVTVDGSAGPQTKAAVNRVDAQELLQELRDRSAAHYQDLVAKNPNLQGFLRGWLKRAAE